MNSILLSFPHARHLQPASIVGLSHAVFNQVLLGGQGQLHALAPYFKRFTPHVFVCGVPEIFFTPQSFEAVRQAVGDPALDPTAIVHMRFGPVRYATVMKGVRNKAVVAEHEARDIYSTSMSPFAVGDVLPASFSETLLLLDESRGLRRPDGRQLPEHILGSGFGIHGLPPSARRGDSKASQHDPFADIDVMCGGDFDGSLWDARRSRRTALRTPQGFRDLMDGAAARGERPPLALVPWNMSDPADFASNVLDRFLDEADPLARGHALALMPFNETFETPAKLSNAVARIKRHPRADLLLERGIFFVGVASEQAITAFADLFSCFVLDAGDPEFSWSFLRLSALGIHPIVFGAEGLSDIGLDPATSVEIDFFPFELSEVVHQHSAYGSVHVEAGRISRRQYRALQDALRDGVGAGQAAPPRLAKSKTLANPEHALHRLLQQA